MTGAIGWQELFILFLIFVAIAVIVIRLVLRAASSPRGGSGDGAKEILRQRYARGEISREEYQERLQDLS